MGDYCFFFFILIFYLKTEFQKMNPNKFNTNNTFFKDFKWLGVVSLVLLTYFFPAQILAQPGCPTSSGTGTLPSTITGTASYSAASYTITSGNTVTITNATLTFGFLTQINVQAGAKLLIFNSTLQGSISCPWNGIRVYGSTGTPTSQYNSSTLVKDTISNGYVLITKGSFIKYADAGVRTYGGGIVVANKATFTDNNIGIYIDQSGYTDANANKVRDDKSSTKKHSANWINNTTFKLTAFYHNYTNYSDQWGVYLAHGTYIEIGGCKFENDDLSYKGTDETRGGGVYSAGTQVAIHNGGDGSGAGGDSCYSFNNVSTLFKQLSIGVSVDTFSVLGIDNANFTNVFCGITLIGGNHHVVKHDTFTFDSTANIFSTNNLHYFVKTFYATDLLIYGNYASSNWPRTTHFIDIDNSSSFPSEIYKNTLICYSSQFGINSSSDWPSSFLTSKPLVMGIYFNDDNTGVHQLKCNSFTGMEFDIYIDGTFAGAIGGSTYGAKNSFSTVSFVSVTSSSASVTYYNFDAAYLPSFFAPVTFSPASAETSCPNLDCWHWTASIEDVLSAMELAIFPNPANDHLSIRYANNPRIKDLTMEIYDLHGRLIYSHLITNEPFGFDVNTQAMPQGLYVYRITSEGISGKTGKFQIIR